MKYLLATPVAAMIILGLFLLMVQLAGLNVAQPVSLVKLEDPAGFDLSEISFEPPARDVLSLPSIDLPTDNPLQAPMSEPNLDFSEQQVAIEFEPPTMLDVALDIAPMLMPIDSRLSEINIPKPPVKLPPKKALPKILPPKKTAQKKTVPKKISQKKTVKKITKKKTVKKVTKASKAVSKTTAKATGSSVVQVAVNTRSSEAVKHSTAINKGVTKAASGSGRTNKPVKQVRPRYPKRARRRGIEGEVVVSFVIAKNGSIEKASLRITHSQPAKVFDKAVLKALAKWKFPSSAKAHKSSQRLVFKLDK